MKKKALLYGILIALVVLLAACGKQQADQPGEPDTPPEVDTQETLAPEPEPEPEPSIPFADVPEDASYYDAVVWAYKNGVVSDGSTFEPDSVCTRGQAIAFIWRAMGSPEPQAAENPFDDISSSAWYYKPVLWAYENNITTQTTFNPDNSCNNAAALSFLWKAEGEPMASIYNSPIALAAFDMYYARPVAWAENNGMFEELGSMFDPNALCRRVDIIAYLCWAAEQWAFTEEDRTIQAEYEQIFKNTQPYASHGSGLLYADYVDMEGDGKAELLTVALDYSASKLTAAMYVNVGGHAEKSCEEEFDAFPGNLTECFLCKGDGPSYIQLYGMSLSDHPQTSETVYQFYKIEKGAVTLENDLRHKTEYVEGNPRTNCTDLGEEITREKFDEILQRYTDEEEIFYSNYSYFEVKDSGLVSSAAEYWEANCDRIYAAVLEGDFSYFAGDFVGESNSTYTLTLNEDGSIVGGFRYAENQKPISINVTENGVIECVIIPVGWEKHDGPVVAGGDGVYVGDTYDIYPIGVRLDPRRYESYYDYFINIPSDQIRIVYTAWRGSAGAEDYLYD